MTTSRARLFGSKVKSAVIKVGSTLLTDKDGQLDEAYFDELAGQLARVQKTGRRLALVSSGAVAAGWKRLDGLLKPGSIPQKQAAAALGQSRLMWLYEHAFTPHGVKVGQVLLTHEDLKDRRRYLNSRHTLTTLLDLDVIPVINENDTVAVEEIMLGDNDNLSAMVATLIDADLLLILSDVEGLFAGDPRKDPAARFIPVVEEVTPELEKQLGGSLSPISVGGMLTKVQAARTASLAGITTVISHGRAPDVIPRVMAGEPLGTLFLPQGDRLTRRKHWIAFVQRPKGALVVDEGAKGALLTRGKSLLASGVIQVQGRFGQGDSVEIKDSQGSTFAQGLANYDSREVEKIKGLKSSQIEGALGYKYFDEIIHRDNLVLVQG